MKKIILSLIMISFCSALWSQEHYSFFQAISSFVLSPYHAQRQIEIEAQKRNDAINTVSSFLSEHGYLFARDQDGIIRSLARRDGKGGPNSAHLNFAYKDINNIKDYIELLRNYPYVSESPMFKSIANAQYLLNRHFNIIKIKDYEDVKPIIAFIEDFEKNQTDINEQLKNRHVDEDKKKYLELRSMVNAEALQTLDEELHKLIKKHLNGAIA